MFVLHLTSICLIFMFVKNCLFLYKTQVSQSPIRLIPWKKMCYIIRLFVTFSCLWIVIFFVVRPRVTMVYWINPLPIFKHNYVIFLEKSSSKDSCCDKIQTNIQLCPLSSIMTTDFVILFTILACYFYSLNYGLLKLFWKYSISWTLVTGASVHAPR